MTSPHALAGLAEATLVVHFGIVLFNVFGLVAIPIGAWRGWRFVRVLWWRALHLAILGIVALQAVLQRACFLTLWQSDLLDAAGQQAARTPLLARWIDRLLFWPLPAWVFAALYLAICLYTLALWFLVPPQRRPAA